MAFDSTVEDHPGSTNEPEWFVSEQEKEHAKTLVKQINEVIESQEWKDYVEEIKKNRLYAKGKQHSDKSGELVRANLIHPEVKALVTSVYAKDPDISVTPSEAVGSSQYPIYKKFGKTLELVIRNQFGPAQANLKSKAKAAVRASATSFIGWVKLVYQKDYEQDPEIKNRIKDTQDDIERINYLIDRIEGEPQGDEESLHSRKQELEQMMEALKSKPEVIRSEGLVIDRPLSEDMIFSLEVMDSEDIRGARWLTQRIWMTVERCIQRFGFCPAKGTRYSEDKRTKSETKTKKGVELVSIFEMWSEENSRVYTLIDGYDGYMRQPFTPAKVGERFHGFFPLIFDPVDGEPYPNCLVQQLRELQDEHNETRTNFRYHRKHSIPHWVGLNGKITPKDAAKIQKAEAMEIVLIEGDESQPLKNYLDIFYPPAIDPKVYLTEHIREDWENITRRGDASRGVVAKPKTATEAQMLQGNLQEGSSESQDVVEEWMRDITQYTAELTLQEMSFEQVQRIAGKEAVWPEMTKEVIFDMVSIVLRAGSSGKPNKGREQEQWLKFLPELRETLLAINEMETSDNSERAEILRKLLEMSLVRFDERIDIDEFFPKQDEDKEKAEKQQKQQQQMMAQREQQKLMAAEMRKLLAEINNINANTIDKLAEAESRELGDQLNEYMSQLDVIERTFNMENTPQQQTTIQ